MTHDVRNYALSTVCVKVVVFHTLVCVLYAVTVQERYQEVQAHTEYLPGTEYDQAMACYHRMCKT